MKRIALALAAVLIISPMAAEAGKWRGTANRCLDSLLDDLPSEKLRKREKNDLLFMREEEKLARDVYLSLYEKWGLRIFRQIAKAEKTHMAATLQLIEKYGLEDPVGANALGVFTNTDLQALYEELSTAGNASLVSALLVGATIEDVDIYDLQRAYAKTNNQDLQVLYQNLMKGSRNHLRAFTDVLERYGESYEPAFLSPDEVQAILDSPREQGVLGADGELLCSTGRGR
jgi:hypothetical protein